jgi:RNA polymerase sigma-70 factor (ECF subfamily)
MAIIQPRPRRIRPPLLSVKVAAPSSPIRLMRPALTSRSRAPGPAHAPGSEPAHASSRGDTAQVNQSSTFEEIYQRWFGTVSAWIRGLGGPGADSDDIAQEVFLVARRRLADFDGANVKAWLYRIAQRQVRDFRRRAWFKHLFLLRKQEDVDGFVHVGGDPAVALEQKEAQHALYAILDKIREERRMTFILFEVEGRSGEEIAEIQRIPLNTVWTRLHHARNDFFHHAAKLHRSVGQTEEHVEGATEQGRRRP